MPAGVTAGEGSDSHVTARPQWIAKMYAGKVGRDHLGLGSVSSDQILPTLSYPVDVPSERGNRIATRERPGAPAFPG